MDLSTKNIFRILAAITLFLLFLAFLYQILGVITWLAASLLITILLSPLVDWFQRFTPRKNRSTAVLFTFVFVLLIVVFFGFIIFPPLAKEIAAMIGALTEYATTIQANPQFNDLYTQVGSTASSSVPSAANVAREAATIIGRGLAGLIAGISSGVFVLITIVTLTFFMLLDTQAVLMKAGSIIPDKYQSLYQKLNRDLFSIVSKYFTGVVVIAAIAGVSVFIPLYLTNAPYALALAFTIAIFDLIPMIGATIGTIIVVLVCLLSGNLPAAVVITIFVVIYQQIENNVIIPLVQKQTVKMSPLAILVALLIGGAIWGIIGALLAIPAAAFIKVVFESLESEGFIPTNRTLDAEVVEK